MRKGKQDRDWVIDFPATVEAVEELMSSFIQRTASIPDLRSSFAVELLLREGLANAVEHGSGNDSTRQVHCEIRLRDTHVTILVRDQGPGFDWRSAWNRRADAGEIGGRGIEILRRYATRVRFNRAGNVLMLMRKF